MADKKQYLEIGKIVNTHGIKGDVKIQVWADDAEFLLEFDEVYIDGKPVEIISSRVHKNCVIAKLDGIDDVNAAMRMKNKMLFINRDDVELDEGEFFIQDIIGATVITDEGAELGKLHEVLDLPKSTIYVVRGEREILIPAVPEFILDTDVENMKITVHMIEGL